MTEGVGKQRINGETITGIALMITGILFIYAGRVNEVWATIVLADYIILAVGAGFTALGIKSIRDTNRRHLNPEHKGY